MKIPIIDKKTKAITNEQLVLTSILKSKELSSYLKTIDDEQIKEILVINNKEMAQKMGQTRFNRLEDLIKFLNSISENLINKSEIRNQKEFESFLRPYKMIYILNVCEGFLNIHEEFLYENMKFETLLICSFKENEERIMIRDKRYWKVLNNGEEKILAWRDAVISLIKDDFVISKIFLCSSQSLKCGKTESLESIIQDFNEKSCQPRKKQKIELSLDHRESIQVARKKFWICSCCNFPNSLVTYCELCGELSS